MKKETHKTKMSKEELKQQLIEEVVKDIKYSLEMGWEEAIEELLSFTPVENLIGYLPEESWEKYKDLNQNKNEQCPICNCHNTEAQYDYPHMSECNACGSEWITDTGEVTLDAHKDVS